MTIDPERAAFIKHEYRYITAKNAAILGADKSARSVEIQANVNEATANSLAATILAQNANARIYEVVIEGLIELDDLVGGIPRYIPEIAEFHTDGRSCLLLSYEADLETGLTTGKVLG
ncbi:hypothetical protein ACIGGE_10650 [Qipengyuania sp. NPDC077410]|uniref:hypothetical protein n=1 Tax=Qipengyuania sp. NPDC077410 TaxID=3364496 RepID=UPI0037C5D132